MIRLIMILILNFSFTAYALAPNHQKIPSRSIDTLPVLNLRNKSLRSKIKSGTVVWKGVIEIFCDEVMVAGQPLIPTKLFYGKTVDVLIQNITKIHETVSRKIQDGIATDEVRDINIVMEALLGGYLVELVTGTLLIINTSTKVIQISYDFLRMIAKDIEHGLRKEYIKDHRWDTRSTQYCLPDGNELLNYSLIHIFLKNISSTNSQDGINLFKTEMEICKIIFGQDFIIKLRKYLRILKERGTLEESRFSLNENSIVIDVLGIIEYYINTENKIKLST